MTHRQTFDSFDRNCLSRFLLVLFLLVCQYYFCHYYYFRVVVITDYGKFLCINFAYCSRNVLSKKPQPTSFLFWKKGTKALKGSCQNIFNSAVDQGRLTIPKISRKETVNSLRIKLSNYVDYFIARKHKFYLFGN